MKRNIIRLSIAVLGVAIIASACEKTPLPTRKKIKDPVAQITGEDLTAKFEITRLKETKEAQIVVKEELEQEWALFAGYDENSINFADTVARGDGTTGTYPIAVPTEFHKTFYVTTSVGTTFLAERRLPLKGGYNFRDLGGYRTTDGRTVRYGQFFRSEPLNLLSEGDLAYLASIPVRALVDLRHPSEAGVDQFPSTIPEENRHRDIYPTSDLGGVYNAPVAPSGIDYFRMLFNTYFFEDAKMPLIFHCTAGRDRTGVVAAVILLALGVDEDTVAYDFMLTRESYLGTVHNSWATSLQESWIRTTLTAIKTAYETPDRYFTEALGIDLEAFRDKYLYPATGNDPTPGVDDDQTPGGDGQE